MSLCIRKPARISRVIERWRSDKQARDVRGHCHCIDTFKFFCIQQDEIIANTYFLASLYCSEWNYQSIRTI